MRLWQLCFVRPSILVPHSWEDWHLKRRSERCKKNWMTLTVTHWLLHHQVTVELQGTMGKFVQLSTQIKTYRNCRGGKWGVGEGFEYVSVCLWKPRFSRRSRCFKACKKQKVKGCLNYLRLKAKLLPAYRTWLSGFLP